MQIVIINGAGGCGKDAFVTFCTEYLGADRVRNYSTVDYVKELATDAGWDGTKDDKNRKFLADLKTLLTEWNDVPFKKTGEAIDRFYEEMHDKGSDYLKNSIMFIHCREPKEIQRFKESFLNVQTLLIRRAAAENMNWQNEADKNVLKYDYDCILLNNGTIEEFRAVAAAYVRTILKLEK